MPSQRRLSLVGKGLSLFRQSEEAYSGGVGEELAFIPVLSVLCLPGQILLGLQRVMEGWVLLSLHALTLMFIC